MNEKQYPFVQVKDSEYRQDLIGQDGGRTTASNGNRYGTVVHYDEANLKHIPVICGHGGSMWLCPECADRIVRESREALPDRELP